MKIIFKILVTIIAVLGILAGFGFMFTPQIMMDAMKISATDAWGLSFIRGDLSAMAIVFSLTSLVAVFKNKGYLLVIPFAFFLVLSIGKFVGVAMDGDTALSLKSVVPDIILTAIMFGAWRVLR